MSKASERRIILGVHDSPSGLAALQWAVSQVRSREAQPVAVRSPALGLPRHGGRHHRHLAHPHVVLFSNEAEQRDAPAELVCDAFRAVTGGQPRDGDLTVVGREHMPGWRRPRRGSASRYCRSHAGRPVVVVATEQESL
jgi:nucleotide-binding universal stress UspA family protein